MTHIGTLRDYRFAEVDEAADDIRGAKVYGMDDEKLGKIDDVIFDHATGAIRYVVVDTGGWLSSKKFIVRRTNSASRHNTKTTSRSTSLASKSNSSRPTTNLRWNRTRSGTTTKGAIARNGNRVRSCTAWQPIATLPPPRSSRSTPVRELLPTLKAWMKPLRTSLP